jgi:hypothetical protein
MDFHLFVVQKHQTASSKCHKLSEQNKCNCNPLRRHVSKCATIAIVDWLIGPVKSHPPIHCSYIIKLMGPARVSPGPAGLMRTDRLAPTQDRVIVRGSGLPSARVRNAMAAKPPLNERQSPSFLQKRTKKLSFKSIWAAAPARRLPASPTRPISPSWTSSSPSPRLRTRRSSSPTG